MKRNEFYDIINSELNYDIFVSFDILCAIKRTKFDNLNGYIYLPPDHPWYKENYESIEAEVHGGLTYSSLDKDTGYWCIGFDTAHLGDLSNMDFLLDNIYIEEYSSYKNWDYVKNEVENLAFQASVYIKKNINIDDVFAKKVLLSKNNGL